MDTANLRKVFRRAGVVLLVFAGLSLLFCLELVGSALDKRYSVMQSVGYWPLFTLVLLLLAGCFTLGAPHLLRRLEKKRHDESKLG